MSRFISDLLEKEKTALRTTLDKLEQASGESSIDSRLLSEIIVKSKSKIKQLGLDANDTNAEELYAALINLAQLHDTFLSKALGGSDPADTKDMLPRIQKFTNSIASTKTVWAIKHSVAKRQLKSIPPKLLMKKLGYRSIDSMIKREPIDDLFAGIRVAESSEYINKFFDSFKNLRPSDFESRKMLVRLLTQKRWQNVTNNYVTNTRDNLVELKELGSVVIMNLPVEKLKGATIMLLPLILHKLNNIHIYSSYFKFEQVQNDFGDILSSTLLGKSVSRINMAGLDLSWNVIRDHFGKLSQDGLTDVFEPHIQLDDLEDKIVEESLYKLEPALHFWFGNNFLGLPFSDGAVSLNLLDIATDFVNNLSFAASSTKYLSLALWDELLARYLSELPLQDQVLQQLDSQTGDPQFSEQEVSGTAFA